MAPAAGGRLAGVRVAVKDNIDVAGMPTTAACPSFGYRPAVDAVCVAALRAAGAVIVGKTNMDQFATGLVGMRSPAFGVVPDAARPLYVPADRQSGSAVAVALGLCDLALGTDTAGSGRVPAAFQGVVGFKPSLGRVASRGWCRPAELRLRQRVCGDRQRRRTGRRDDDRSELCRIGSACRTQFGKVRRSGRRRRCRSSQTVIGRPTPTLSAALRPLRSIRPLSSPPAACCTKGHSSPSATRPSAPSSRRPTRVRSTRPSGG